MTNKHFELDGQELWDFAYRHLEQLRTPYGFAASDASTGVYNALFGRDSLWMLLFLLDTVKINVSKSFHAWVEAAGSDIFFNLCANQGTRVHDLTEEQPGKITHEIRTKIDQRLQNMGLTFDEQGRFFGGFDQTFLFVTAFRRFSEQFPNNPIVSVAWPHVEQALGWITMYADDDGDGLFEYHRRNPNSLPNQVWKDSFDSVIQTGIDVPPPPIAWIEVQAYAYRAFLDAEHLYRERGNAAIGEYFKAKAQAIRTQVNQRLWLENESCFAIGLDGNKQPITMISSNAGHALWSGIVEPTRCQELVRRLLKVDMTTGYGLRTLSSESPFYDPFAYHRGCIWPFDNAVFVIGLLENGYRDEALQIIKGVSKAITLLNSPIELYLVIESNIIVDPPLAPSEILMLRRANQENRNQGWTAAAILYFAAVLTKGSDLSEN